MLSDSALQTHLTDLRRLRRSTGWVMILGPVVFAIAGITAGLICGMRVPLALGLFFLLLSFVLHSLRRMLVWRVARLETLTPEVSQASLKAPWLTRAIPYFAGLVGLVLPLFKYWGPKLGEWVPALEPYSRLREPDLDPTEAMVYGCVAIFAALYCAVLAPYFAGVSKRLAPECRGVSNWMRAGAWLSLIGGISLLIIANGSTWGESWFAGAIWIAVAFLGGELLVRAFIATWKRFYDNTAHAGAKVATDSFALQLLFSRFNPLSSLFAVLADVFGIDLKGAWALLFIRRALLPLAMVLLLLGWISTCFITVPSTHVGVLERFGKPDTEELLDPGLHLVLPWPMHKVQRVATHRVESMPIGFSGAREGASMLWTVEHADEEYKLLLGNGQDLVTINAELHYRVSDPYEYLYNVQNPIEALGILSDRVMMRSTVGRTLDAALSENLAELGMAFRRDIQSAADEQGLGLEIVDLTMMGLHPPVGVAAEYEAVVAAQIDQEIKVIEARTYAEEQLPKAEAEAKSKVTGAEATAITRLARARGEAEAFVAMAGGYAAAPRLFLSLRLLENAEAALKDRKYTILDRAFEEDAGTLWRLE